jgi:integrase/recombinase XerD
MTKKNNYQRMGTLKIEKLQMADALYIGVYVPYDDDDSKRLIKTVTGRIWHPQERLWLIPYNSDSYKELYQTFDGRLTPVQSQHLRVISSIMQPPKLELKAGFQKGNKHDYRESENTALFYQLNDKQKLAISKLEELLIEERKAYDTRKGYIAIVVQVFHFYRDTLPSQISEAQLRAYIVQEIKTKNISKSRQNHIISAFKAFYERLLGQSDKVANLYRPQPEEHLPKDLKPEEIEQLLKQVGNLKHKCILMLMYGSGLRVGEVVRLRLTDIDYEQKTVFVDTGKHYKDRYTILSNKAAAFVKRYLAEYQPQPQTWLFESPNGSNYSERSVQQFFADAMQRAKIKKNVSTHSLRHAFAHQFLKTHHDLELLRKLMGHASIKTTQIYLSTLKAELSDKRSPLDDLDI